MNIAEDLQVKLNNNQRTIFITEADELLAVWRFKKANTFKRSVDFSRVPQQWRYSAPPNDKCRLMPYHVSYRLKSSHAYSKVEPAFEHTTRACHHTHSAKADISVPDLTTLQAVDFAKRNVAPYVSPILDAHTLTLVGKDLGLSGRAVTKVIDGRQYIAFVETTGARKIFPGTLYSAKNRQIIKLAIGALGIKNMVKNGGILTICITVPLTILECFLEDHTTLYTFAGHLASDLMKIGISSVMGVIFGLAVGTLGGATFVACAPIAVAILVSVSVGFGLNALDDGYKLTEKLTVVLEDLSEQVAKATENKIHDTQRTLHQGFKGVLRSSGLRSRLYY